MDGGRVPERLHRAVEVVELHDGVPRGVEAVADGGEVERVVIAHPQRDGHVHHEVVADVAGSKREVADALLDATRAR